MTKNRLLGRATRNLEIQRCRGVVHYGDKWHYSVLHNKVQKPDIGLLG